MDPLLYNAAITGNNDFLSKNKEKVGAEITPDKKTVLHLASELGKKETVELILSMHPKIILKANSLDETALHLATRGGHYDVARVLLDHARKLPNDIESTGHMSQFLLEAANYHKDTALHEAARYDQSQVLSLLVKEDPNYSHSANSMEETPLYIAANRGYEGVVDVILTNCKNLAYYGPNGTTALHGAVVCGSEECTRKLLKWNPAIVKEPDSNGQTPLHYAAYYGFSSIASHLLREDSSLAYLVTKDCCEIALHVAAIRGHVSVMKEILLQSPDCCSMVNIHGRNILHLAIEHNQIQVVEYIVDECPVISSLINQKDIDGYTPSHLQALLNCYVPKLIEHAMIDKGALSEIPSHLGSEYEKTGKLFSKAQSEKALKSVGGSLGVLNGMNEETTYVQKHLTRDQTPSIGGSLRAATFNKVEQFREYIKSDIVVAALIVTVTFTAGFTMPGGFIQSGSENQGMAVLSKSVAFQAFIVSDTLGLLFSMSALFLYSLTAGDIDDKTAIKYYWNGGYLTILALISTMLAFVTGTYAVLSHLLALAITTCVFGSLIFVLIFMFFF